MTRKKAALFPLVFPLIVLCLCTFSQAQIWSGILDPTRAIDWTPVGIPGGIPNLTSVCANINASTYGNGSSDATAAIQSALNKCGASQVVLLSAGKFRVSSLTIPSNVVLRGQNATDTVLDMHGTSGAGISFGSGVYPNAANTVSITGGATAGSTSITVAKASNISVGSYLIVTELNESYVTDVGEDGQVCGWCDLYNGTRLMGQTVEVTSVSGNTIGITPLYKTYPNSPAALPFNAGAKHAGLESLQVYSNNTGYTMMELLEGTAYCWVKGVENNFADGDHLRVMYSYRDEIRDSYFSNAYQHSPGGTDSDVFIAANSSGTLVENNIMERLHSSILINWGASGNVIAYNYSFGAFADTAPLFETEDVAMHGAHPAFNLIEGNVGTDFHADSTWGSNSHNTVFRNWWRGTTQVASPLSGRGLIAWAAAGWAVQHVRGLELSFATRYTNMVGNAIGSAETAALKPYDTGGTLMTQQSVGAYAASRSYDSVAYGYNFGYGGATDGDNGFDSHDSTLPFSTAFIHGDYEYTRNSVAWDAKTANHNLPPSLFHTSKPAWFGTSPWPLIGPDVTGGTGARGYANANPAMLCYSKTQKDSQGMLAFNAATCYGSSVATIAPPTGLKAVAH